MDIVERQQHRLAGRQPLEHGPDRIVQPVALGALAAARGAVGLAWERREDCGELARDVFVERAEHRRFERAEVVVERIDHQAERDVALELGRAPGQDEIAAVLTVPTQLGEQTRLADPGLADDLDAPGLARGQLIESSLEFSELASTTNECAHML